MTATFAALGGLLFGYDTGVISGAMLFIRGEFALGPVMEGLVVSSVLFGAAVGALSGGRLADHYGRRRLLIATSIVFGTGALLSAIAPSASLLVAARVIVGLGIGLSSATVTIYISEVSPAAARGWLVSLFQLAVTVGIMLAYLVAYAASAASAWRLMLGLALVPAVVFGLAMLALPESPRWLAKRGRLDEARAILARVRGSSDVGREVSEIRASLDDETVGGGWPSVLNPAVRPALVVGVGLAVFQQVTGINTVIYYAPTIIQSAGVASAAGAILATVGIGLVNVLATIVSMRLVDRAGRRPLLLTGIAGMAVTLAALGVAFAVSTPSPALAWAAVGCLMLYVASFAISLGPIFWLLISEIYPTRVRGVAQGVAAGANWTANIAVSFTFLILVQAVGTSATVFIYCGLAIAAFVFSYHRVPETKGKTLEQIEAFWRDDEPRGTGATRAAA
jgi:sugar porter (SP) family MFS transporter